MMHLVSLRDLPEPPSDFERACRLLRDNLRRNQDRNELWTNGRWVPASVDDIMRRANELLKNAGRPQFTRSARWKV